MCKCISERWQEKTESSSAGCLIVYIFFEYITQNVFNKCICFEHFVGKNKIRNCTSWIRCPVLQHFNFFHLVLWKDIYSSSTTKEEKMCEKLLCCFMLPVGTIALTGISVWQNPLISPYKTTSYVPQGCYSKWVSLISLYIAPLPLQKCIVYSA